ncbi:MAG: HlyC/CorC family transporter [Verrucomicrobia bacterium]|nr:HlyC/CorC family transporter [Verrucomicrobiota bacterium]
MLWLILAIAVTLSVSFVCSLFEAIALSTTTAEIEALKKSHPRRGQRLETIRHELDETISAILTLNTIANSLGSVGIGVLGAHLLDDRQLAVLTVSFGIVLLVAAEVLPKNLGVVHRRRLQPWVVYPLWWLRRALFPITWVCNLLVRLVVKPQSHSHASEEEIILLAERGAKQGTLSKSESSIIANALSLDNVRVGEIMTPRTVLTALRKSATISDVFREYPNLPFGRMPVYGRNLDDIVGLARRRDLLKAKANDQDAEPVEKFMQEIQFVPETATVANALQVFLKSHQQILVVVDEFGSTSGVVTMEDVMEQLLGREIFEKDDIAVDMRELARTRHKNAKVRRPGETAPPLYTLSKD